MLGCNCGDATREQSWLPLVPPLASQSCRRKGTPITVSPLSESEHSASLNRSQASYQGSAQRQRKHEYVRSVGRWSLFADQLNERSIMGREVSTLPACAARAARATRSARAAGDRASPRRPSATTAAARARSEQNGQKRPQSGPASHINKLSPSTRVVISGIKAD